MDKYCVACPRECSVRRDTGELGYCLCNERAHLTRVSLHRWEEPPVSGQNGSGTLFFSGCSLRCVFCQNRDISRAQKGRAFSVGELAEAMLALQAAGAHNVNLVTPTHYLSSVVKALEKAKPSLRIPVVYNCGGYEKVSSLERLDGLVDIYLPDCKYFSSELSARYSSAANYFEVASKALIEMYRQVEKATFAPYRGGCSGASGAPDLTSTSQNEADGDLIIKGLIIRHLILPGCRRDSIELLSRVSELLPIESVRLSLMRQFTPDFVNKEKFPELCRKLTSFEYNSVLSHAEKLGFVGYTQSAEAASSEYTPDFCTEEAFELLTNSKSERS